MEIRLKVNGEQHLLDVAPTTTLLRVLRDLVGLDGSKESCGRGECGACTVLVAGSPVMACIMLAALVDDEVITIEGLAEDEDVADLRARFADTGGFQCGFCTPGQIVRAISVLRARQGPIDELALRRLMSGNVCRCTGYDAIIDSMAMCSAINHGARVTEKSDADEH